MRCSAVLYSRAQRRAVQCSAVQLSAVQCSAVLRGVVQSNSKNISTSKNLISKIFDKKNGTDDKLFAHAYLSCLPFSPHLCVKCSLGVCSLAAPGPGSHHQLGDFKGGAAD